MGKLDEKNSKKQADLTAALAKCEEDYKLEQDKLERQRKEMEHTLSQASAAADEAARANQELLKINAQEAANAQEHLRKMEEQACTAAASLAEAVSNIETSREHSNK